MSVGSGVVTRRVPGYTSLSIVRGRVVVSGRVARIEGRADGRQLGGVGRVLWRMRVWMGMVQVLVERQGRWCVWRMVLVWLACLCRRSVVSCWRRFPLVPWRLSFSSRMLLPIIDGPPQDRIAKHQDSAYGKLETAKRLLHGQLNAGTGGGARRERGGDGRTNAPWACASRWSSWDSRCGCDGDNEMEEGRWDGGWCGAACALSRSHTNGWQVSVCLVRLRQLCPGAAPGVMQTRDEV